MSWDRVAPVYDWQLALERPALRAALDLADIRPEERLLDVGTGTGAVLRELAERASHPHWVVGVDSSASMLARAPALPAGWQLMEADVTALPLPDRSFEIATAAYLLHLLDENRLTHALAEVRRVLVPGGKLVTVTPVAPRGVLARPYAAVASLVAHLFPQTYRGPILFDPRSALERNGFRMLRGIYVQAGYPSLCILARSNRGSRHQKRA